MTSPIFPRVFPRLHSALAVRQNLTRWMADVYQVVRSFVVGVAHMQQCNGGDRACLTKDFPKTEKEFPRTK